MSRIGQKPVAFTPDVKVTIADGVVTVEGKLGKLSQVLPPHTAAKVEGQEIIVTCDDSEEAGMMHGLARSLVNNMVVGVTQGYKKDLEIAGVGYKAALAGQKLTMNLGFSHEVIYMIPAGVKAVVTDGVKISVSGCDKQLVGEAAARIRRFRKTEPYKGKGIKYATEHITLKPGKKNA